MATPATSGMKALYRSGIIPTTEITMLPYRTLGLAAISEASNLLAAAWKWQVGFGEGEGSKYGLHFNTSAVVSKGCDVAS